MTEFEIGNLAYLAILGVAVVFWFFSGHRQSLGKSVQQALAWGLIFLGIIAAYGMWDEIRGTILPQQASFNEGGSIEIPRARDGHFYLTAEINGTDIEFVVDTGASDLVLAPKDAAKLGFTADSLQFFGRANTANGEVRTAPVTLRSVAVGPYEDRDIRASVTEGALNISLLGMSYLNRYEAITIANGQMKLSR
ncbi:TIGR02281 family clan AA aspartic protease [Cognatishimia sp. SS12]|uniref:retropepsin-like aspartic protease family protein n=1 Tax=Cognatishimia sp. SS12 TaxID=2979465 RepID=UPI00232FF466|nr:TIGR02281 family clan AA aspartic protease [Cognatishimia sp. SS12]MDC0737301.1 TIGR02281 family clan AA aspartic protease [Cognatishimia sp. SS12]